jgi:signal transduction histidine kinase
VGHKTKLQVATVPYYLMAVLLPVPLAATAAGVAALAGELMLRRERGLLYGDIAGAAGRRALLVLAGASIAQTAVHDPSVAIVGAALVMGVLECVTLPIVVWPMTGASPLHIVKTAFRDGYLFEGALYLVGLLGALAARQQLWAIALLALPTALAYLAFQAMQRAEQAQRNAEEAQARSAAAQQLAEEAVGVRDDFLTAASHDLRTPLTNIVGRAELIQMRLDSNLPLTEEWLAAQLGPLRQAADRMMATVEEMTDVAQLQMGEPLSFDVALVDLTAIVRHAAALLSPSSARCTLVEPVGPALVRGDAHRLERVIQNVVDNAVKYSAPQTPVEIRVEARGKWLVVRVSDRGRGIPTEDLPRIFTRFYRGSNAASTKGSGIGLASAKAIVEQHGGRIDVRSTPGYGTTVSIRLPAATPRAADSIARPYPGDEPMIPVGGKGQHPDGARDGGAGVGLPLP